MYVGLKQPRGDGERYVTPARAAAKETTIAPALSACSPREHDISTREPLLHIRKLNLIGSE